MREERKEGKGKRVVLQYIANVQIIICRVFFSSPCPAGGGWGEVSTHTHARARTAAGELKINLARGNFYGLCESVTNLRLPANGLMGEGELQKRKDTDTQSPRLLAQARSFVFACLFVSSLNGRASYKMYCT